MFTTINYKATRFRNGSANFRLAFGVWLYVLWQRWNSNQFDQLRSHSIHEIHMQSIKATNLVISIFWFKHHNVEKKKIFQLLWRLKNDIQMFRLIYVDVWKWRDHTRKKWMRSILLFFFLSLFYQINLILNTIKLFAQINLWTMNSTHFFMDVINEFNHLVNIYTRMMDTLSFQW